MYFSKRKEYQDKFEKFIKDNGIANVFMNAISWMQTEEEGKTLLSELCKERKKPISENKKIIELLEDILRWFNNFGFNAHGILVQDDIEDPEELIRMIKESLTEMRKEKEEIK